MIYCRDNLGRVHLQPAVPMLQRGHISLANSGYGLPLKERGICPDCDMINAQLEEHLGSGCPGKLGGPRGVLLRISGDIEAEVNWPTILSIGW